MDEITKGDAPELRTREEFEAWLKDKPRKFSIVLAARAALRVLPLVSRRALAEMVDRDERFELLLRVTSAVFRALAIGRAAARYPTRRIDRADAADAYTADAYAAYADTYADTYAADDDAAAAAAAADAAYTAADADAADANADAAYAADAAALAADDDDAWRTLSRDTRFLADGGAPNALAVEPLWLDGAPKWAAAAWARLRDALPESEHWEVWIDWYEARLKKSRWSEKKELIYVSVPLDVWEQGHVAANTWIYEELQTLKRKKPRPTNEALDGREFVEQSPAPTSFRIVGDKIDAAPETAASIDETIAAAFYEEAKRKARDLRERLERAQADKRLQANLALLEARLGGSLADVSVGHLLPSLYSLERDFNVYNSEDGRKEHSLELIAALGDAAGAVRDFVSLFPKVRLIEAEALALRIVQQPETQNEIAEQGRKAIATASESPHVTPAAASALQDTEKSVTTARDADERARQLSYLVLDLANLARAAIVLGTKEVGGFAGDCWREIRNRAPSRVGKLAALGVTLYGLSALAEHLPLEKINLLRDIGGVAEKLGRLIDEKPLPKANDKPSAPAKSDSVSPPRRDSRGAEKNAPHAKTGNRTLQKRKR
jgi:hypothetical protein